MTILYQGTITSKDDYRRHSDSSASYDDRKKRRKDKISKHSKKSKKDDKYRNNQKSKKRYDRRDYSSDNESREKSKKYERKRERSNHQERKDKKPYKFDSPPLDYEFNQSGNLDKYGDVALLSTLLPTLANSKPEEIIEQLSEYHNITKTQQFKLEKKLYVGSIPENITTTQVC